MTNAVLPADLSAGLPHHLVAIMRAELPSLTDEIITALRQEFPEYDRPMDGAYGQALQTGVYQALSSFVDMVADPTSPHHKRDEVFRTLGRFEAYEGRGLDTLQAACRVGARLAWRRVSKVGRRARLSSSVMSELADSVIGYTHELATLSVEGYHEARSHPGEAREAWRRRLLALLTETPAAPLRAITDLAGLAGWAVPEEVTPVAVQGCPAAAADSGLTASVPDGNGSAGARAAAVCLLPLGDDVLADLTGPQPCLLFPGPLTGARRKALNTFLAGRRAAVGLTVPLESAGDSLRWARQALELLQAGAIDDGQVTLCEDQLVTLLLMSDRALAEQVIRRQLARLTSLAPRQRGRLTDTLAALVEAGGTVVEAAGRLHVHPQTVRYRLRQFEQAVGGQLADPEARFELELALRISRLRHGMPAAQPDAPAQS